MINKILNRTSVRSFENKPIDSQTIKEFEQVVNSVPTSMNNQPFSVIFIQDKNTMNQIKEAVDVVINQMLKVNNNARQFLVDASLMAIFCVDYNRAEYSASKNNINPYLDGYDMLATSIGDTFIGATTLMNVATLKGYGSCFLGMIKLVSNQIKQILKLEGNIIPVIGLVIGHSNQTNDIKPKINKVFYDQYDLNRIAKDVDEYDITMSNYFAKRNSANKDDNYSKAFANYIGNKNTQEFLDNNYKNWLKLNNK